PTRARAVPRAAVTYDGIVLAGGRARRLGGVDKPALLVGGRSMLATAVAALGEACLVTVVGPEVTGGPVAAVAAGLRDGTAAAVVVLAADLPFVTVEVVNRLVV